LGRHWTWDNQTNQPKGAEQQPNRALVEALAERDRFLEQYPKMNTYQNEIDRMLDKAGPQENRFAVLAMLMEGKLAELDTELRRLSLILNSTIS
jgi:hypothetical protein